MAQSATPATQNPTSRHNRGTASQLRKRVRVTDEEDFRVTDEGLSSSGRYHAECHQITAAPCRLAAAATSAAAGTSCWDRSHNLVAWAARGL